MSACFATLFAGGGLADIGLIQAGLRPLWAVERDPDIAAVYRRNVHDAVIVADVADVDWSDLLRPDLLWMSPPCQAYSIANRFVDPRVRDDDAIAQIMIRAVQALEPAVVIVENVPPYGSARPGRILRAALDRCGYWTRVDALDASAFGVPQTRRRMVLIGARHALLPMLAPTRRSPIGWAAACADLLDSLPTCEPPAWIRRTLAQLPAGVWLLDGRLSGNDRCTARAAHQPAMTVTAGSGVKRAWRIWDGSSARIASPRMLARLQGAPDTYALPPSRALACRIIGNGVPPPLSRAIAAALMESRL